MKVWKRCAAAFLALGIWGSSIRVGLAAGTWNRSEETWSSSAAGVAAEAYGMDEKEIAVLENEAILRGAEYQMGIPYANGTGERKDLVAVDYRNKIIYAKTFTADGYTWLPEEAVLKADKEEQERLKLQQKTCFYEGEDYNASQAFAYTGHDYEVEVNYRLYVTVSAEEQERLLRIPYVLGTAVQNLEKRLKNSRLYLRDLGDLMPDLNEILAGAEDCGEEQQILKDLYREYQTGEGLSLYGLCLDYTEAGSDRLAFALAHGEEVREASAQLYEQLVVLKDSTKLKAFYNGLSAVNTDQYQQMKRMYSIISSLLGTGRNPGALAILKEASNWMILQEGMIDTILKNPVDTKALAGLEASVYALRNMTLTIPKVQEEILQAADMDVECRVTIYDITVEVFAQTVTGDVDSDELVEHTYPTEVITLPKGTSAEDVRKAIEESGVESGALQIWNEKSSLYQIDGNNYLRQESSLPAALDRDIPDYQIRYTPKECAVKTNYQWGTRSLPYGYQMLLPINDNEDRSYDYQLEYTDGRVTSLNQGVVYKVTEDVKINRSEGTSKVDMRLYGIVANDNYGLGKEAQAILNSEALNSPTVSIRIPTDSVVGEIQEEEGRYTLVCRTYASGIYGMTWEPVTVRLMRGSRCIAKIPVENESASWEDGEFTHVIVEYELKIQKVSAGILNREVKDSEVLQILNLPDVLVKEVTRQQEVMSGTSKSSIQSLYQSVDSVKSYLSKWVLNAVYKQMNGDDGRNAVLRLTGDETGQVKGVNGEALGYGGWSVVSSERSDSSQEDAGELALYKYLNLCKLSDWSLSDYYKNRYDQKLKEQASLVADCLETILEDGGCNSLLESAGALEDVKALIPNLRTLAENVEGPNEAMNT
jgi:hypothetical protein